MVSLLLLDLGRETEVEAKLTGGVAWVGAEGVKAALGWDLRPEGLCRDDVCIPVTAKSDLVGSEGLSLGALAELIHRPLAVSFEEGVAYLGPPLDLYVRTVGMLEAPDFELPDLDGRVHSLSEHRGSKVLLAVWASW